MKYSKFSNYIKNIDKSKKNIVFISHDFTLTGAPIVLVAAAKTLKKAGYGVCVLSKIDGELSNNIQKHGIDVIVDKSFEIDGNIDISWFYDFDLVVCSTLVTYHIVSLLNGTNVNVLWWVHEAKNIYELKHGQLFPKANDNSLFKKRFVDAMPNNLFDNVKVVCGGEHPQRLLSEIRNYHIEQLLYSVEDIYDVSYDDDNHGKIRFAIIATIYKRKGQDIFAAAIKQLGTELIKKCEFYFVGVKIDQDIYEYISNLASLYPENVFIMDQMPHDKLQDFYKKIDCLVCASTDDPMPVVVAEAMMLSKIIICSENAGNAKYITDGYDGFVYHSNDYKQLSYKLEYVINYYYSLGKVSERAREVFLGTFSEEALVSNFENIFNEFAIIENFRQEYDYFQEYYEYIKYAESVENVPIPIVLKGKEFINHLSNLKEDCKGIISIVLDGLSRTGIPKVALSMAKILINNGYVVFVFSHARGDMEQDFIDAGCMLTIDSNILRYNGLHESEIKNKDFSHITQLAKKSDLHISFGVATFSHIIACNENDVNTIWYIHDGQMGFDHFYNNVIKSTKDIIHTYTGGAYVKRIIESFNLDYRPTVLEYGLEEISYKPKSDLNDKLTFILPGTYHVRKGQDVLAKAIKLLPNEYKQKCEFIFIGDNFDDNIYNMVSELTTEEECCKMLDSMPIEDLYKLYEEVDVFVCPSRDDPMPVVLTEAMATNRIIICSDKTGTADYIRDEVNGFVFKSEDYNQLHAKIKYVIDNIDNLDKIRNKANEVYNEVFRIDVFEKNLLDIVEKYRVKRNL